uniref:Ubiquitin-like domain-containing protein n=1 Tax=Caenorhabditis tropicalis TaxID=1561998 RepID=A0A1I7TGR6_9PELO
MSFFSKFPMESSQMRFYEELLFDSIPSVNQNLTETNYDQNEIIKSLGDELVNLKVTNEKENKEKRRSQLSAKKTFQICVITYKTIKLDVREDYRIDMVMKMIAKKSGVPFSRMQLSYQDKPLIKENRISDYDIQQGSTLSMDFRKH